MHQSSYVRVPNQPPSFFTFTSSNSGHNRLVWVNRQAPTPHLMQSNAPFRVFINLSHVFTHQHSRTHALAHLCACRSPYCCPTPPISPAQCSAGPIESTQFVKAIHAMCPSVYAYAYDDLGGLHTCDGNTSFEVRPTPWRRGHFPLRTHNACLSPARSSSSAALREAVLNQQPPNNDPVRFTQLLLCHRINCAMAS